MNIQSNYTYIPKTTSLSVNKKSSISYLNFRGVEGDSVQFSRKYISSPYARIKGACNMQLLKDSTDRDIYKKVPAMRGKTFTKEDYKSLSKEEKEYLREIINQPYYEKPNSIPRGCTSTIKDDRNFFIGISKKLKKKLDKEYPEGWSFISLGGSPSIFAQTLGYMGEDTKELPFSFESALYSSYDNIDMGKYLDDLGITEDYLYDGKKKIVADYAWSGTSLKAIEIKMLQCDHCNANVEYEKMQDLLKDDLSEKEKHKLFGFFFEEENIKAYSSCPSMHKPDMYDVERMKNEYGWNMSTKLMNFALIDYFESNKGFKNILKRFIEQD